MTTKDQDCRTWFEQGKQLPTVEKQYNYFSEGFRKGEPFHPWAWAGIGLVWCQKGNLESAIDAFEKALTLNPDLPGIAQQLKIVREKAEVHPNSLPEPAQEDQSTLHVTDSPPPTIDTNFNQLIRDTTKHKKVDEEKWEPEETEPDEEIYEDSFDGEREDQFHDTLNNADRLIDENVTNPITSSEINSLPLIIRIRLLQASKCGMTRDFAGAEKILRQIVETHPKISMAWSCLAETCLEQEKLQYAEECAQKAISLAPKYFKHWRLLGDILQAQKKPEEASNAYQKVIDLDPGIPDGWSRIASLLEDQDRSEEAIAILKKGLNVVRDKSSLYFLLGNIFSEWKNYSESEIAFKNGLQSAPDNAVAWRCLGAILFEQHKLAEAENALKKSIELDKSAPHPWYWLGRVYEERGIDSKAEECYCEVTRLAPDAEEGWLQLEKIYFKQKRMQEVENTHIKVAKIRKATAPEDALRELQDIAQKTKELFSRDAAMFKEKFPDEFDRIKKHFNGFPLAAKALQLIKEGNLDAAAELYLEGLKQDPDDDVLWFESGNIMVEKHEFEKAIEYYKKACDLNPKEMLYWDKLGICEMTLNHYENAIPIYKKMLELDPKLLQCWDPIGQAFQFLGKFREAAEAYEKYIEFNSSNAGVWTNFGIVREELGDIEGAKAAQLKAIDIDPNYAKAWNNLAVTYIAAKYYAIAEEAAMKAITINPHYIQARNNLCAALIYQKRYPEAEVECLKALEFDPQDWGSWHNLSLIRSHSGRYTEGVFASEKALQLNPQDIDSLIGLAVCKEHLGDHKGAEITYQKAIKMSPSNPVAYLNLGSMYIKMDRLQEAIELFQTVTRVIPALAIAWVHLGEAYLKNRSVNDAKSAFRKARELTPKDSYILKRIAWNEQFLRSDNIFTPFIERPNTEPEQEEGAEDVSYTVQLDPESPEKNRCTRKNEVQFITMTLKYPRQSPIVKTGVLETEEEKSERGRQEAQVIESWIKKGFSALKSRDLKGAAFAFRKVIELGPWVFMQYQNLASVYLEMNQPRDAVEVYQKLTRAFPGHALAWVQLGEAYLADHKVQDARSAFRRARELAPNDSYLEQRIAWSEQFIKNEEVLPSYNVLSRGESEKVLAEYVDWPSFYKSESFEKKQFYILESFYEIYLPTGGFYDTSEPTEGSTPRREDPTQRLKREADEYHAHGKINQARETYLEYLKHVPDDAEVWCRLGEMSLDAGKKQRAEREFQECLKHDPKNAHAIDRLDQLKRVKERRPAH